MSRLREVREQDRKLLKKVVKDHGARWMFLALAVWYGAAQFADLARTKRWSQRRLAAFRFLREITRDYTWRAVYDAADEHRLPDGAKSIFLSPIALT